MKCPECGKEMGEGYIGVKIRSVLFWLKKEPKSARLSILGGATELLRNTTWFQIRKIGCVGLTEARNAA